MEVIDQEDFVLGSVMLAQKREMAPWPAVLNGRICDIGNNLRFMGFLKWLLIY